LARSRRSSSPQKKNPKQNTRLGFFVASSSGLFWPGGGGLSGERGCPLDNVPNSFNIRSLYIVRLLTQRGREVVTFPCRQCNVVETSSNRMIWGNATMNVVRPLGSAEIEKSSEVEAGGNIRELARGSSAVFRPGEASDVETSSDNLAGLLRRVSEASTREIENLVGDLQALRKKLHTDGNRIQRDITEYAELTQQVMQLTKIISESVKKLPTAPSVNR